MYVCVCVCMCTCVHACVCEKETVRESVTEKWIITDVFQLTLSLDRFNINLTDNWSKLHLLSDCFVLLTFYLINQNCCSLCSHLSFYHITTHVVFDDNSQHCQSFQLPEKKEKRFSVGSIQRKVMLTMYKCKCIETLSSQYRIFQNRWCYLTWVNLDKILPSEKKKWFISSIIVCSSFGPRVWERTKWRFMQKRQRHI